MTIIVDSFDPFGEHDLPELNAHEACLYFQQAWVDMNKKQHELVMRFANATDGGKERRELAELVTQEFEIKKIVLFRAALHAVVRRGN